MDHFFTQKSIVPIWVVILLFGVALLFPSTAVDAQATGNPHEWGDTNDLPAIDNSILEHPDLELPGTGDPEGDDSTPNIPGTPGGGETQNTDENDPETAKGMSGILSAFDGETSIISFVYRVVTGTIGWIMTLAAGVLDHVLERYVLGYGDLYTQTFGHAVEVTWEVIRDLVNVALIFGLVYIGFRFILFADDGAAKRNLAMLIIAALLVNFSLFFAKAIVDVSHAVLNEFNQTSGLNVSPGSRTLSSAIIGTFSIGGVVGEPPGGLENLGWWFVAITVLTYLIATFIFFSIAAILVIRTVVITFLLIFSPIMFLGMIFPALSGMSRYWMQTFLSQTFLAPVVFLLLYISLVVTNSILAGGDRGAGLYALNNNYNVYAAFLLGTGFLIISLIAAQKMGSGIASSSVQFLDNSRRRMLNGAVGVAKGGARYGARAATAPIRGVGNYAGRKGLGLSARALEAVDNRIATTSSTPGKWVGKGTLAIAGLGTRTRQNAVNAMKNRKLGGYSYQDDQDFAKKEKIRENRLKNEKARSATLKQAEETFANTEASADELESALTQLADTIKSMSEEELTGTKLEKLKNPAFAANLNDKQIEQLEKSGNFSSDQIGEIKDARKTGQINIATKGMALDSNNYKNSSNHKLKQSQRQNLLNRSVADVGKLPVDVFQNSVMYEYLTPAMLEERLKSGSVGKEDTRKMRSALAKYRNNRSGASVAKWDKWELSDSIFASQFFNQ